MYNRTHNHFAAAVVCLAGLPVCVGPSVIRQSLVPLEGRQMSERVLSMDERTMIVFSDKRTQDVARTPHRWSVPTEFRIKALALSMIGSGHHSPLPGRAHDSNVAFRR